MEHLFTWAGNQTQVSSMVGQFCTRNVPITSPRLCISKQVFFQTWHSLRKWPERTCNKPATSGNHLPPASAGCVMFLSFSLKVGGGSAVFLSSDGCLSGLYMLNAEARAPSDFWAKWILNAASKRQKIAESYFYIWYNHTGVIRSFSASNHQPLNSNRSSLAGAEPETDAFLQRCIRSLSGDVTLTRIEVHFGYRRHL